MTIEPGERASVGTGIAVAIPEGHAGLVVPRSGLAARHGISLVNAPGLIDAGYRGEVRVLLWNGDRREPFAVAPGDRIAQLVLVRVEGLALEEVAELDANHPRRGRFRLHRPLSARSGPNWRNRLSRGAFRPLDVLPIRMA